MKAFDDYPNGDGTHDADYAVERRTGTTPFKLIEGPCPFGPDTTYGLWWNGGP